MNKLVKTEGMNPSGVEMIHTPISSDNIGADNDILKSIEMTFAKLSTLREVAKEVVETQEITRNHLSRLKSVSSDSQDYLEYDIDYLIYLIKEYIEYTNALNDWKMLSIADDMDLHGALSNKAIDLYKYIISKCNNILTYNYL